jgi:1-acyl-sn-glycerol-3-phosphate acyltransferase
VSVALPPFRETRGAAIARLVARFVARRYFRLHLHGLDAIPKTGPIILAGNHSSFLDGPLVFTVLPRPAAFLVKSEMYRSRFLIWALGYLQQIPVRRGHPDRAALRAGLDVLARGGALGMFPEGRRGTGALTEVQHGIGYLALRSGCQVLPVVCLGTAQALPPGRRFPRFRAGVHVSFGEPFTVDVVGDPRARASVAAAAECVRVRLLEHLAAARARVDDDEVCVARDASAPRQRTAGCEALPADDAAPGGGR